MLFTRAHVSRSLQRLLKSAAVCSAMVSAGIAAGQELTPTSFAQPFEGQAAPTQEHIPHVADVPAGFVPTSELEAIYARLQAAEDRLLQMDSLQSAGYYEALDTAEMADAQDKKKKSVEGRLESIEKTMKKEADAAKKKKEDDAKKPTGKWTGRIHADYWGFPSTDAGANNFENPTGVTAGSSVDDRFLFRRVRIGLAGDIPDNMTYKLEVDFNTPSAVQFKDMYFGWKELPLLQTVLIGNQKRPYGLDHLNSSRYNVFIERPFIIEAFNQDARRFGICSYQVSDDQAWNTRLGAYMSTDIQNIGTVTTTPFNEVYQAEVAGRIANTIWYDESSDGRGYAHWGIAGTVANTDPNATGAGGTQANTANFQTRPEARTASRWLATGNTLAESYELVGLEGLLNLGPLQICGEYQSTFCQRQGALSDLQFDGWYVYASYFLTGEHMVWERESGTLGRVKPFQNVFAVRDCDGCTERGWGAWQVACRLSQADLSDGTVLGGEGKAVTFALNWYLNPYTHFQSNVIVGNIDNHAPVNGFTAGDYTIVGVRGLVDF